MTIYRLQLAYGLIFFALLTFSSVQAAGEVDLKPGDIIGPHNWQRVQGMVGENLLNRIKGGYTFKIKEPKIYNPLNEFVEATERDSGQVKLGANGDLVNYVAGIPFPNFNPNDPQAGIKLAWNFYWRWLGDDLKEGGRTKTGRIIRDAIERDGSERRANITDHAIKTRGRVTLDPKFTIPGYEHIDWMQLRVDEYPR